MERGDDYSTYWEEYYESGAAPEQPSKFARYVRKNYAKKGDLLVELGCGNGRDARFFARHKLSVIAIDQCAPEIDPRTVDDTKRRLRYAEADFTELPEAIAPYDLVYSRFTLHSVSAEGQARSLAWSARNLISGGRLCIETRGQKNELYQKGTPVDGEPDAFIYDDHYRRFVDLGKFVDEIESNKFKILEASEDAGYAPFEDTDYHFIRVIAEK